MTEKLAFSVNKEIQIFLNSQQTLEHRVYHQGKWIIQPDLNLVNLIGACKVKNQINTPCRLVLQIEFKPNL